MPVGVSTDVVGIRDTIRALNRVEPGLRRQFNAQAAAIAAPAIAEVQKSYTRVPLSGMNRAWTQGARRLFPFDLGRARRNVKLKVDASRTAIAVINIQQRDAGTAIFESAGRRTRNHLGNQLGPLEPNHTRVLGPAVFRKRREITNEMMRLVRATMKRVEREVG